MNQQVQAMRDWLMMAVKSDKELAAQLAGLQAAESLHAVVWRSLTTYIATNYPDKSISDLSVLIAWLAKQTDPNKTPLPVMDLVKHKTVPALRWLQGQLQATWKDIQVPVGFDKQSPLLLPVGESAVIVGSLAALARFKREFSGWLQTPAATGLTVAWLTGEDTDQEARLPNQTLVYNVAREKWKEVLPQADTEQNHELHRFLGALAGREINLYLCPDLLMAIDKTEWKECYEAFVRATPETRRIFFCPVENDIEWEGFSQLQVIDVSVMDDLYTATLRQGVDVK